MRVGLGRRQGIQAKKLQRCGDGVTDYKADARSVDSCPGPTLMSQTFTESEKTSTSLKMRHLRHRKF